MCGICGLYGFPSSDDIDGTIRRMTQTIAHRGPDGEGTFVGEGVALGHRRLSIIDLSDTGAQPMTFGSATVVYNGESYNFPRLRTELEGIGHVFRGHSDTEVLLHAYDAWGLPGLERLEGIFAFALWDSARHRLILMRDRLGIKPLFYAWQGGRLAFGSEIKAVLAAGGIDRTVDDQALMEFLWYGNSFEERTIYRAVRALQPGCRLVIDAGQARSESWWHMGAWLSRERPQANRHDSAIAVRDAVDAAVSRQLVSDVPVGLFLSGGVDSSSIAASAAVAGGRRLTSFSVAFDYDKGVNELPKARRVAQALGLDHHELCVRGDAIEEVISDLVQVHDEPFADAANIPLYLLARELRGKIKVVLQGDGGDEMFAGYRRYSILRAAAFWRLWPHGVERTLTSLFGAGGARLARIGAAAGNADPAMRMALLLTVETLRDPPTALLTDAARRRMEATTDPFAAYRRCAARFENFDPVQQMLLTDIALQLPSQFLTKVDRATMAHGMEARVPLLDEGVASLAVGLPVALKVRGNQKKIVLRDAMRNRLPAEILDGPKTGFGVPYEEWLRGALHGFASSVILESAFVERFGLDRAHLQNALAEHRARRRDRGFLLWKMLQLALWSKRNLS
ncbi:MAG TPA: asparagine synthase (glutamine-hydrolyzing) [Steroidobacteraceae bacterium]|nr:asparagine synthase (glutamine-hydrolyzing) [Steroidobacteraceae bacterium]